MTADEAIRVRQGACETTPPAILRELALDPSVTVRASLALNPALPEPVVALLAADTDARVRTILARKLAALTPTLTDDARKREQQDAVASLTAMVAEAALRVRTSLAEAVREMPDGPRDIILRLAHDPTVTVCEPVIRCSPMLTQEDLVALAASGPPPSTVMAIAARARIGAEVSDAIVGSAESAGIRALLANHTAQIREATLDALAVQSEEHTDWQEPLIHRPHLPPRAQRMLAEIVNGHLLERLAARIDLDPKVRQALSSSVGSRPIGAAQASWAATAVSDVQSAMAQARALHQAGTLNDYAVLDALRRNTTVAATAMLAVKAGVAVAVVDRACELRSAKAVISLAWKAGLSAQTAVVLQSMLARLAPDEILRPHEGAGFSISEDEMRRQLTFLGVGEPEARAWMPRRL